MATRTIDLLLSMEADPASVNKTKAGVKSVEKSLKDVETQANRTKEKMEKLAQVGQKLAFLGAGIIAPFALAMKKYVDSVGDTEGTSARIIELNKRWEESQVRIGRVTAEIVLPALEKALDIIDKVAAFAEENPGFVQAALGIGGSLVIAGTLISTVASVVSTIATIQGLIAGLGGLGGIGAALGGLGASIAAAISAAAPFIAIAAAVVIAAEATRNILNWALGTDQTWGDIATTLGRLIVIMGEGFDGIMAFFGVDTNLSKTIADAFGIGDLATNYQVTDTASMLGDEFSWVMWDVASALAGNMNGIADAVYHIGSSIVDAISSIFFGEGQAGGGMVSRAGIYPMAEQGREFVLNNQTTRAAESVIGGTLTQERLLAAMGGRRVSYYDNRRIDSSLSIADRRAIANDTLQLLNEALA